jgi:hypothetical protein
LRCNANYYDLAANTERYTRAADSDSHGCIDSDSYTLAAQTGAVAKSAVR